MPTSSTPPVSVPDAVDAIKARQFSPRVEAAVARAANASRNADRIGRLLLAGEMPADARRAVTARLGQHQSAIAAANKRLAAFNPGLIVRTYQVGGAL